MTIYDQISDDVIILTRAFIITLKRKAISFHRQVNFCFLCFHFNFIDATIYVGGLDEKVSETLLWELFLQAGPVGKLKCTGV